MIADLLIRFLLWLARKTPPRVITGRNEVKFVTTAWRNCEKGEIVTVGKADFQVTKASCGTEFKAVPIYLTRYFLTWRSPETEGMDRHAPNAPSWGLYLHRFHRSDDAGALHNHPWKWAVSIVLKGGYSEERRLRGTNTVVRRSLGAGSVNVITNNDFHRVDLMEGEAWTLFLVGPLVQSWGFWDRESGKFTDWKKFLGIES